jgi:hypothetical protein
MYFLKVILAGMPIMKHTSLALTALFAVVSLSGAMRAQAQGHSIRIDQGSSTSIGCMTTWTEVSDAAGLASISPGGTYGSSVACVPNSSSPADLYPNGVSANDSSTAIGGGSSFAANGGEMFQYFAGSPGAQPTSQVVEWTLANSDIEVEMNGWCPTGSAGKFTLGGSTYTGGCGTSATDFLFNSAKGFIGYVNDTTNTVELVSSVPTGWTSSGTVSPAPEMDVSSSIAALLLLAGGLAVIRDGRRLIRLR